jgi:endonuclease YncB( thermonuclease family)
MHSFLLLVLLLLLHPPYSASLSLQPPPLPSPIVIYQQQQKQHQQHHNNHDKSSPFAAPFLLLAMPEQPQGASSKSPSLSSSSSSLHASKAELEETRIYKGDESNQEAPRFVGFQSDTVVRVTDANHVRLQRAGLVALAAVKTPTTSSTSSSGTGFSECLAYAPEYKLQQLLPAGQVVQVKLYYNNNNKNDSRVSTNSNANLKTYAVILKQNKNNDGHIQINQELVAAGFAVVRKNSRVVVAASSIDVLSLDELKRLETAARLQEKGLFQQCDGSRSKSSTSSGSRKAGNVKKATSATTSTARTTTTTPFFVAEFQPLDQKETIVASKISRTTTATTKPAPPKNPGDTKGCSDFETYEDALRYYEYYYSWYGDVARLDRDGDGIPCPGLPHTQNQVLYRIKKPTMISTTP